VGIDVGFDDHDPRTLLVLTGGLLVRVQPEEPISTTTYGDGLPVHGSGVLQDKGALPSMEHAFNTFYGHVSS
jgi:hypothetical protein